MRLYYTTDLHGSEKCWKKFLVAPRYYQADVIIVGGDITGKFVVPIVHLPNGQVEATFLGINRRLKKDKDVENLKQLISNTGQYPVDMTQAEFQKFSQDPSQINALFTQAILERVKQWMDMADEKLRGQNVRCYVSAGNDDIFEVDDVIAEAKIVQSHDGKVIDLGEGFELLGCGYANMTPWKCPRDISEEELAVKLEALASQVKRPERAIFDIHVPPYGVGIDDAPELTEDMRVVLDPVGEPKMIPVGSTAVRDLILKYQPMLTLHGHIHESSGIRKLGSTTLANPGSEYGEGILRGTLVEVDPQRGLVSINNVIG
jgi:Icc-related predicted phosphoesterase